MIYRKLASTKSTDNNALKCAIDHILDAQQKGEINEDNVLYIVENINVAGKPLYICFFHIKITGAQTKRKKLIKIELVES